MNQVNIGNVVDGENGYSYSVDYNDGFVYIKFNINMVYVVWVCKLNGISDKIITKVKYEKRFRKMFA